MWVLKTLLNNARDNEAIKHLVKQWKDQDTLGGIVLEALVAHHLVANCVCLKCGACKYLCWNGGPGLHCAWADVLCIACGSAYEIKSKVSLAKFWRSTMFGEGSDFVCRRVEMLVALYKEIC